MDLQSLSDLSRRRVLALLAGGGATVAGGSYLLGDESEPDTERVEDEEESRQLAEAYAPTLYFGAREKWFPTDPRPYTSEEEGETVVTGFDALDGYTADARESGEPPNPTVFYQVLDYPDSPLACVQFWFYSAFDQFTTNFHWHDWEVLHVFVDRSAGDGSETATANRTNDTSATDGTTTAAATIGESVLFVASAHSRKVPNNEHLDPPQDRAGIIAEVGSHSSTLGVNARPSEFQRTGLDELAADISNNPVEIVSGQSSLPLAYGLPRDEGLPLPYAVPELDGEPLTEHEKLPNVRPEDLVPEDVTVDSFEALSSPPEGIPMREGDYAFVPETRTEVEGDVDYELVHIDEVRHIDGFSGPLLSFSFRVPRFVEDAFSGHLSTVGLPWDQKRFTNPTADISDPQHRAALADRYEAISEGSDLSRILGAVREATGADDAPGSNGVSLLAPSVETVALLESEPEAVPSFSGAIAIEDPPEGEHRFTVNGAGMAPYSQKLAVEGSGDTRVGVEGAVPMASNEDAVKVEGETEDGAALDRVALEDDFSGRLYDARPPGPDGTFGLYAHREGAYTADVRDENGRRGARRLNPNTDDERLGLKGVQTGKAALTDYLVRFLAETHAQAAVFEDGSPAGIDDVPTGQDVTEEVVNGAVAAAEENAGTAVEDVGDAIGGVSGTETETESDPGDGTTPTATATDEKPGNGGNGGGGSGQAGTGFTGVLKAIDNALLVAVGARGQARNGAAAEADKRLERLRGRLHGLQRAVENSESLPEKLGPLAANRVERMLPRVEAAIEAEQ